MCKKGYCLSCRVEFHAGQTCIEYKRSNTIDASDEAFLKFVKGKKFKTCPHCKHWVEKTQGCDHMRCKCGKEFCYKCGGIYGKCECGNKFDWLINYVFSQESRGIEKNHDGEDKA